MLEPQFRRMFFYLVWFFFQKDHIVSYLGDLSELADPLADGLDYIASSGLLTLGINCVKDRPKERPDMKSVLNDVAMLYNSYKETEKATCKWTLVIFNVCRQIWIKRGKMQKLSYFLIIKLKRVDIRRHISLNLDFNKKFNYFKR